MTTAARVIAQMGIDHYRQAADFERDQKMALAATLEEVIRIVGFEGGPPYDEPLFMGTYSIPRLLDHIRERVDT